MGQSSGGYGGQSGSSYSPYGSGYGMGSMSGTNYGGGWGQQQPSFGQLFGQGAMNGSQSGYTPYQAWGGQSGMGLAQGAGGDSSGAAPTNSSMIQAPGGMSQDPSGAMTNTPQVAQKTGGGPSFGGGLLSTGAPGQNAPTSQPPQAPPWWGAGHTGTSPTYQPPVFGGDGGPPGYGGPSGNNMPGYYGGYASAADWQAANQAQQQRTNQQFQGLPNWGGGYMQGS